MLIKALYSGRYIIFLSVLGMLLWGLFRPTPPPQYFDDMDKYLHFFAFFITALATRYASPKSLAALAWTMLIIAAPLLEYLQHQLQPNRTFNYWDIMANLSGVMVAFIVWPWLARILLPKPTP